MKGKVTLRRVLAALFLVLFLVSAGMVIFLQIQAAQEKRALRALAAQVEAARVVEPPAPEAEPAEPEPDLFAVYAGLKERNPDFWGWLTVEGTIIDYPVMHTPDDPEHYLRRAFDGTHSSSGVPFLDGACFDGCGNYIIYGHHMSNGTMFAPVLDYADPEYWKAHPTLRLDTPEALGTYEVVAAFYSKVFRQNETGVFRYYQYTDLTDPAVFDDYVTQVRQAALYDTGVTPAYGDQLLTLITCSYHVKDGRFVLVARQVTE